MTLFIFPTRESGAFERLRTDSYAESDSRGSSIEFFRHRNRQIIPRSVYMFYDLENSLREL